MLRDTYEYLYRTTRYAQAPASWQEGKKFIPGSAWQKRFPVVEALRALYNSRGPLLDMGAGGHIPRRWFGERKIRVVDLDFALASKPDVVGDVRRLPFSSDAFGLALCFDVLEHLPPQVVTLHAIKEIHRVCRYGAIVTTAYNPERRKFPGIDFQLHLTVQGWRWWRAVFIEKFSLVYQSQDYPKLWVLIKRLPECESRSKISAIEDRICPLSFALVGGRWQNST